MSQLSWTYHIYHTGDLTRAIIELLLSHSILLFCTAPLTPSLNYSYILNFFKRIGTKIFKTHLELLVFENIVKVIKIPAIWDQQHLTIFSVFIVSSMDFFLFMLLFLTEWLFTQVTIFINLKKTQFLRKKSDEGKQK